MYVYQADLWCDACGERIAAELTASGHAPADPDDERTYDSDDFPKWAAEGETDSPSHCASGADCLERIDLADYGCPADDPLRYIGAWIGEDLTDHGESYLRELLAEDEYTTPYQHALHAFWREAYADYALPEDDNGAPCVDEPPAAETSAEG